MQTHSLANDTLHDFLQILKILGTIFIKNRAMKLSYLLNIPKQNARRSLTVQQLHRWYCTLSKVSCKSKRQKALLWTLLIKTNIFPMLSILDFAFQVRNAYGIHQHD